MRRWLHAAPTLLQPRSQALQAHSCETSGTTNCNPHELLANHNISGDNSKRPRLSLLAAGVGLKHLRPDIVLACERFDDGGALFCLARLARRGGTRDFRALCSSPICCNSFSSYAITHLRGSRASLRAGEHSRLTQPIGALMEIARHVTTTPAERSFHAYKNALTMSSRHWIYFLVRATFSYLLFLSHASSSLCPAKRYASSAL